MGNSIENNDIISNIRQTMNSQSPNESTNKDLDKDAFLNLLVTQMQYQDPLNPMSNEQYLAQMAQFSSLEQMQNLNATFEQTEAFSLIGKNIYATSIDENTLETEYIDGVVESVRMNSGKIYLNIDGKEIDLDSVQKVTMPEEKNANAKLEKQLDDITIKVSEMQTQMLEIINTMSSNNKEDEEA